MFLHLLHLPLALLLKPVFLQIWFPMLDRLPEAFRPEIPLLPEELRFLPESFQVDSPRVLSQLLEQLRVPHLAMLEPELHLPETI